MKIYRRHNCERKHRTYRTLVRCMIPRAEWVSGTGEIALIAWCHVPTITLWDNERDAHASKARIDSIGCGGRCRRAHELVRLVLP